MNIIITWSTYLCLIVIMVVIIVIGPILWLLFYNLIPRCSVIDAVFLAILSMTITIALAVVYICESVYFIPNSLYIHRRMEYVIHERDVYVKLPPGVWVETEFIAHTIEEFLEKKAAAAATEQEDFDKQSFKA